MIWTDLSIKGEHTLRIKDGHQEKSAGYQSFGTDLSHSGQKLWGHFGRILEPLNISRYPLHKTHSPI